MVYYFYMFCNVIIHNADKENGPKSINDLKLINAGKILENNRTLMESRLPLTEVPGGVITMHVVVRPLHLDKNTDKQDDDTMKKGGCSCSIL
ncbi:Hypothetical predicted protein [Olea europaea subsp. europaea]|uniref:UBL3-like ubiquitin domain-containing protein n=1 Tax=Olea europaea subsp. europaea TaxID=158383 RepID=A0A8S0SPN9_OLEEU|nr:Hypothetical predicted protein [Olea europaea subsp. europaea]